MENEFKKMFGKMRTEKLGADAKYNIRERLLVRMKKPEPASTNTGMICVWSLLTRYYGYSLVIFLIIFCSGISYASTFAMPNNILYPVKTNINEPLRQILAFSPEAKLKVEAKIIETRISEIVEMKMTDSSATRIETVSKISNDTSKHISKFTEILNRHSEKIEPAEVARVTARVETILRTYNSDISGDSSLQKDGRVSTSTKNSLNLENFANNVSSEWDKIEKSINERELSEKQKISEKRLKNVTAELEKINKNNRRNFSEDDNQQKEIIENLNTLKSTTSTNISVELRKAENTVEEIRIIKNRRDIKERESRLRKDKNSARETVTEKRQGEKL